MGKDAVRASKFNIPACQRCHKPWWRWRYPQPSHQNCGLETGLHEECFFVLLCSGYFASLHCWPLARVDTRWTEERLTQWTIGYQSLTSMVSASHSHFRYNGSTSRTTADTKPKGEVKRKEPCCFSLLPTDNGSQCTALQPKLTYLTKHSRNLVCSTL